MNTDLGFALVYMAASDSRINRYFIKETNCSNCEFSKGDFLGVIVENELTHPVVSLNINFDLGEIRVEY